MTRSRNDNQKNRAQLALPARYEVGYGKPPVSTRFQPGQSGNPRGRPKGAKNRLPALNEERMKSIIIAEAYREIKVRDGDRNVSVPMATAIIRALAVNAAKGNNRSAQLFSTLLQTTERQNRELQNQWLDTALTYKIEWDKELARRKRLGLVAEDPIPHPDDIVINARTGNVAITGPMTKEEKQLFDAAGELKEDLAEGIAETEALLGRTNDQEERKRLSARIHHDQRLIERIEQLIPSRKPLDWMK